MYFKAIIFQILKNYRFYRSTKIKQLMMESRFRISFPNIGLGFLPAWRERQRGEEKRAATGKSQ
jgi:hypothetical protein